MSGCFGVQAKDGKEDWQRSRVCLWRVLIIELMDEEADDVDEGRGR